MPFSIASCKSLLYSRISPKYINPVFSAFSAPCSSPKPNSNLSSDSAVSPQHRLISGEANYIVAGDSPDMAMRNSQISFRTHPNESAHEGNFPPNLLTVVASIRSYTWKTNSFVSDRSIV